MASVKNDDHKGKRPPSLGYSRQSFLENKLRVRQYLEGLGYGVEPENYVRPVVGEKPEPCTLVNPGEFPDRLPAPSDEESEAARAIRVARNDEARKVWSEKIKDFRDERTAYRADNEAYLKSLERAAKWKKDQAEALAALLAFVPKVKENDLRREPDFLKDQTYDNTWLMLERIYTLKDLVGTSLRGWFKKSMAIGIHKSERENERVWSERLMPEFDLLEQTSTVLTAEFTKAATEAHSLRDYVLRSTHPDKEAVFDAIPTEDVEAHDQIVTHVITKIEDLIKVQHLVLSRDEI